VVLVAPHYPTHRLKRDAFRIYNEHHGYIISDNSDQFCNPTKKGVCDCEHYNGHFENIMGNFYDPTIKREVLLSI